MGEVEMYSYKPVDDSESMERKTADPAQLIGVYQTMQPAVKISLAQAGAVALAATLFFLAGTAVVAWPKVIWTWAGLVFSGVALGVLVAGLLTWRMDTRRMLGILESVFNRDLNDPDHIGKVRYVVRVEVTISDNHSKSIAIQLADIADIEPEKLEIVAARMLMGRTSQRELSDVLGPAQYKRFMDVADKYRWRVQKSQKDARQGYTLTKVGDAVMRSISGGMMVLEEGDE